MEILNILSRLVHIGTAIVVVGGSVFMLSILMPSASGLPDEHHDPLRDRIMGRWKRIVHGGILLFLISGFYNYAVGAEGREKVYHMLIGTKILLAFVVFFLASALVGRSESFAFIRQNRKRWLTIIVVLSGIIVGISGYTKVAVGSVAAEQNKKTE